MQDPVAQIEAFETAALQAIRSAASEADLEKARIEYLGAKQGKLKDLQNILAGVPKELKPVVGKRFNEVRNAVTAELESRKQSLSRPKIAAGALDVTLPGVPFRPGRRHPLSQTIAEFKDIMGRFGFTACTGPEIEDEWHNFEALNIPPEHPARDPIDNFYLSVAEKTAGVRLLRSQTSTVQIRVMEQQKPPIRIVSVGRVYRPDVVDRTHHWMFHQMEGLMVGDAVTMAELKTVLRLFAEAYLGQSVHIRFRPSFFPFTEPSVEVDMSADAAGTKWVEIGGAGMVDPNVLQAVGYDPEQVSGFAFGFGVERFAMRRHNLLADDWGIRHFTTNDLRFLQQF